MYSFNLPMLNVSLIERTEEGTRKLFSRTVDNGVIRLDRFVGHNPEGWKWLRKLRGETEVGRNMEDEVITVLDHKWEEGMFYGLLPQDWHAAEGDYGIGGVLEDIPRDVRFVCINTSEIDDMRELRVIRRGVLSKRFPDFFASYYLTKVPRRDSTEDGRYFNRDDNSHGYLLGDLDQEHFTEFTGPFERAFPLHSFVDVVYPSRDEREFVVRIEYA